MSDRSKHLFIRACFQQPVERTPVWMMRQAGRYLPEYRAVRKNHDFITMCKTPELATEVTLQPIDIVGVDAAILFSDILVIPEAMGMELQFIPGKGPNFPKPIRDAAMLKTLKQIDAEKDLRYVLDAIRQVKQSLDGRVPLIGFSGAPWTLATYMIEGSGSKNFKHPKEWAYARPDLLHKLMEKLSKAVSDYCIAKMDAGAEAIQLFDTWAGILSREGFREFALPYVKQIIETIRRPGIPIIYFAKGAMIWQEDLLSCGADVIGVDWTANLQDVRRHAGSRVALQGNLDPTALYAPPEKIRQLVKDMLAQYGQGYGHIANLGHGILPDIPVEHAREFVRAVKEESPRWKQTN